MSVSRRPPIVSLSRSSRAGLKARPCPCAQTLARGFFRGTASVRDRGAPLSFGGISF
jgi:hypothetical protein